jgi:hypothetical protein
LCSEAEHARDMQNYVWYWLLLWSFIKVI